MKNNIHKVLILSFVSLILCSSAVQAVRFVPSKDQVKNVAHMVAVRPFVGAFNVVRHPIVNTQKAAAFSAGLIPSMSSVKNVAYMIAVRPFVSAFNTVRHPAVNTGSAVLRGGKTAATKIASPFARFWRYFVPKRIIEPTFEEQFVRRGLMRPVLEEAARTAQEKANRRQVGQPVFEDAARAAIEFAARQAAQQDAVAGFDELPGDEIIREELDREELVSNFAQLPGDDALVADDYSSDEADYSSDEEEENKDTWANAFSNVFNDLGSWYRQVQLFS